MLIHQQVRIVRAIFLLLIALRSISASGQTIVNIVPNSSFTNFNVCPSNFSQTNFCTSWYAPGSGTSDFYHTCNTITGPPVNYGGALGTLMPHTSPGMLGFYTYSTDTVSYREYVACQLNFQMVPGQTYSVSYWTSAANGGGRGYYSNNLGILFSDTVCYQPVVAPFAPSYSYYPINAIPQLEETAIITDTTWVQKTYTITPPPGTNWHYLTIGNFRNNALTSTTLTPNFGFDAYYFIDDIVVEIAVPTLSLNILSSNVSCFGGNDGSASVSVTGSNGPYYYAWSNGDSTASVSQLPAGTYTLSVWDSLYTTGAASATVTITEPSSLTLGLSLNSWVACLGDSALISSTVSGGTAPYAYVWDPGNVTNTNQLSVAVTSLSITYTLTVTDANGCGVSQTLLLQPTATVPLAGFTATFHCPDSVLFNNTSLNSQSYNWDYGDGTSGISPLHLYGSGGTYTVSLTATDALGCKDSIALPVMVYDSVAAAFSYTLVPCSNTVNFINLSQYANLFTWTFGDGTGSDLSNPAHTYAGAGPHTVTLIATGPMCSDTLQLLIPALPPATHAAFSYTPNIYDNALIFDNLSIGANHAYWDFGDGSSGSYSWNTQHDYTFNDTPLFYTVCLDVWNDQGCRDSTCQLLEVTQAMTLYIPNSFSPNGDQINDVFRAEGIGIKTFQMIIFDRWGQQVFSSESITQAWDGLYKGSEAPQDVYVWTIEAKDAKGKTYTRTGHVSLVR